MPLIPTTPPVAAHATICSSVMLRACGQTAAGFECEKTTGARERSIASIVDRNEVWEQSTRMPSRFISSSARRPRGVSPTSSS